MNPAKLGQLDNHRQEPWKAPLPQFIEELYQKQFGRDRPDEVLSIEDRAERRRAKKEARRAARAALASDAGNGGPGAGQV